MNDFPAVGEGAQVDVPDIKPSMPEEQPLLPQQLVEIHGWGRAAGTLSHLTSIDSVAGAVSALRQGSGRGVTPRGLGRSYGDAAQNAGGVTLDLTRMDKILSVDAATEPATVTVQAGRQPRRPDEGAAAVRAVGAGAARHPSGHDRRRDRRRRARQEPPHPGQLRQPRPVARPAHRRRLGPDARPPDGWLLEGLDDDGRLFWATIGGMGLTGAIVGAAVELQRVETAYFTVDTDRCNDIDDLMARMTEGDEDYTYSVAWFDAVTTGRHMGRAVLTRGNKATLSDLDAKKRRDPLKFVAPSFGTIPEVFPNRMVNGVTAKAFSEFWYRKAPKHRVGELQNITAFFHPLDIVARVEPGLRPARVPAVPVRRAVRATETLSRGASR